jgi:hypothetical protein
VDVVGVGLHVGGDVAAGGLEVAVAVGLDVAARDLDGW